MHVEAHTSHHLVSGVYWWSNETRNELQSLYEKVCVVEEL
jgi:hypothetical protein